MVPPHSPKLNGHVERADRTHTEEFYEVGDFPLEIPSLNQALQAWEHTNNTVRPHQTLGYLTPQEFLLKFAKNERSKTLTYVLDEYIPLLFTKVSDTLSHIKLPEYHVH